MTEIEKLEAQVAEWMGVANQQILRIQELEQKLDKSDALTRQALCWLRHYRYLAGNLHKTYDTREAEDATLDAFLSRLDARIVEQPKASTATTSERDSAQALLRDAVGVLEKVYPAPDKVEYATRLRGRDAVTALYAWLVGANHVHTAHGIVYASDIYDVLTAIGAFLSRPEVQAIGGGK